MGNHFQRCRLGHARGSAARARENRWTMNHSPDDDRSEIAFGGPQWNRLTAVEEPFATPDERGTPVWGIFRRWGELRRGNRRGKKAPEPLQHSDENLWLNWFHQVEVESGVLRTKTVGLGSAPSQGNQKWTLSTRYASRADQLGDLASIQAGHPDVQQNHVWRVRRHLAQSFLAAECGPCCVTVKAQHLGETRDCVEVVIHNEYGKRMPSLILRGHGKLPRRRNENGKCEEMGVGWSLGRGASAGK